MSKLVQEMPKRGCFNCSHSNIKLGHCDLKEGHGVSYAFIGKHFRHERGTKGIGSTCPDWKQGIDLWEKWNIEKKKERVMFS